MILYRCFCFYSQFDVSSLTLLTSSSLFALQSLLPEAPLLHFDILPNQYEYFINEAATGATGGVCSAGDAGCSEAVPALHSSCRSARTCEECVASKGCGWSVVRLQCFKAHPVATDDVCYPEVEKSSLEWLEEAKKLLDSPQPSSWRAAYRALRHSGRDDKEMVKGMPFSALQGLILLLEMFESFECWFY